MSFLEQLQQVPEGSEENLANFYLIPLHAETGEVLQRAGDGPKDDIMPMRLQYWPETLTYSRGEVGWQARQIPGLSHGLVSWSGGGNPTLDFEVKFTADADPAYRKAKQDGQLEVGSGAKEKNPNINAAIANLTGMTLPKYTQGEPVESPPIVQIIPESSPPNAASGEADRTFGTPSPGREQLKGAEAAAKAFGFSHWRGATLSQQAALDFYGVMQDCSVTYDKMFPSGAPKIVTVSLSFMEVIQLGGEVLPHGRTSTAKIAQEYKLTAEAA